MLLDPAQENAAHPVIGALAQDKIGAWSRGQDVFAQVDQVDRVPDARRSCLRLFIAKGGIAVKIGFGILEGAVF